MHDFWQTELTEQEIETLLDKAVEGIHKRRLEVPAVLALEMHKPLAGVGAQAAVAFAPFLVPVLGFDFVNNYSRLLSRRENIERLLQKLEADSKRARRMDA